MSEIVPGVFGSACLFWQYQRAGQVAQGYGVTREKVEYEDAARVAREQGVSLAQAEALLRG